MTGTFPTFDEIPRTPLGYSRDEETLLRLSLLPVDDASLREAATKLFLAEERWGNETMKREDELGRAAKEVRIGLSTTPALTPGCIAWKIAEALSFFSQEEDWLWWRHLFRSALMDAIELERARQAAGGAS